MASYYDLEDFLPLTVPQWTTCELSFDSSILYHNPLYEIELFAIFVSPSQVETKIRGFWDGEQNWKVRFMPSEPGIWQFRTFCTDNQNDGLHEKAGKFKCKINANEHAIYQNGPIVHQDGKYHLSYENGDPFLWVGCTAWNGALKSTRKEWEYYLQHRSQHGYSVIQFVATQWRGCETDSTLQVAYYGDKHIQINPAFFQRLDERINRINAHGLVAAPVLLWALPYGKGRSLSPGVQLDQEDAIKLAQYMVARYGGHHVIWILGGDGLYTTVNESRWKNIGRAVFQESHPGAVALHSMGKSWIGDTYADETWLDIVGYQSSHNHDKSTVEFITRGPATREWNKRPPKVYINMEPCYEEINHRIYADDVRAASYWSLLAAPVAGVTYGANGIWPWIRDGEKILNHGSLAEKAPSDWKTSLDLPGSLQVGFLAQLLNNIDWFSLQPDPDLLVSQPGDTAFEKFVPVVRSENYKLLVVYIPSNSEVNLYNYARLSYQGRWFDPGNNKYIEIPKITVTEDYIMYFSAYSQSDRVLILEEI